MPIDTNTDETMREIARYVEKKAPGYGFMVLVFQFNEEEGGGRTAHYISNANRKDMIEALREKANILERGLTIDNIHSSQ